jgi:hypothetical protein
MSHTPKQHILSRRQLHASSRAKEQLTVPVYWSVKETAEHLKISEPSVRRHLSTKRLRRYKFFRRTLILASEALSLITAQ